MGRRAARGGGLSAPKFGRFLAATRSLRPADRQSLDKVSKELRSLGVRLSPSTLNRYETDGRIPDILTLHGLATVYGVPFVGLVESLRHELTRKDSTDEDIERIARDPAWHRGSDKKSPPTKAGADVFTLRSEADLRQRIAELEAEREAFLNLASDMLDRSARGEGPTVTRRETKRGNRD